MILPETYLPVLLILLASLVCLGSWINTFKATGAKWRFELFSIDFSIGGIIVVVVAAFTLGTLGSDLAFSDRMLVAGRTAQALALIAGAVFNLGNMLLLAAVGLLGISTAFPLTIGVALIVSSCFHFRPANLIFIIVGIILMVVAAVFEIRSARLREAAAIAAAKAEAAAKKEQLAAVAQTTAPGATSPASASAHSSSARRSKKKSVPQRKPQRRFLRGIIAAVIGGIAMGFFVPVLENCVPGDLGLGAYAAMLLFGVGVLVSTIVYNFYFLNITIDGSQLSFGSYFRGNLQQHLLGFAGGALCLGGLLAAALGSEAPASAEIPGVLDFLLPLLSVPLAFFFGVAVWKELAVPARAKMSLIVGICLFLCALGVFAVGFTH